MKLSPTICKYEARFKYIYKGKQLTYVYYALTRFSVDFRKMDLSIEFENNQC